MSAIASSLPPAAACPRTFAAFKDFHKGETIVVCGCGESLRDFAMPERFVSIGVNDVGRLFPPTYLVVVNPREQFTGERFGYVQRSQARALFTQLDLGVPHPNVVRFRLGAYGGIDLSDTNVLHYTQNSPYVALCLAMHMGATRIGLVGVDFTHDHFFGRTGQHPLAARFSQIDQEYTRLARACGERGIEVVNLSPGSRLSAFPKARLDDFAAMRDVRSDRSDSTTALRIVSYATTPVAGVPSILARCITAKTIHQARCVWATNAYGNGVTFDGDVEWNEHADMSERLLSSADVVIVHNGKVDARHERLMRGKAIVTLAHNYLWNVDERFVREGYPGLVVAQYQATLPEFGGWMPVPNPVPLWEPAFQPGAKSGQVAICYTPSGKHERYPRGHRLYWHGKGYDTTMAILERLAARFPLRVLAIRDRQVSHAESLAMKRAAHIVIDECVTGSYHRNSLEGLAAGAVVINGIGSCPGVREMLVACAGPQARSPFQSATLDTLEDVLERQVRTGAAGLAARGRDGRRWMETHWDFSIQWARFWAPAIEDALRRAKPGKEWHMAATNTSFACEVANIAPAPNASPGLTAIVPQSGHERLPLLAATIAGLRQSPRINQIVVVETGSAALAWNVARRWEVDYVICKDDGPFNRARALNLGSGVADHDLLLWCDNDVVFPAGFFEKAIAEMRAGGWDLFYPQVRINYLSEADTRQILAGTRDPADCVPMRSVATPRENPGCVAMVRHDFVARHGGMCEEFQGWGGEDNAWLHKVSLLGRVGTGNDRAQVGYHLFHDGGGASRGQPANHPHYVRNLALWAAIQKIASGAAYLQRFPAPQHFSAPWSADAKVAFVASRAPAELRALAHSWAAQLKVRYGMQVAVGATSKNQADVIVAFGQRSALELLRPSDRNPATRRRVLVVLGSDEPLAPEEEQALGGACLVLACDTEHAMSLNRKGVRTWHRPWRDPDAENRTSVLVQALSVALGTSLSTEARVEAQPLRAWMYWEGPCPEWICRCQESVRAHVSSIELLDAAAFDKLWDRDRDIDIGHLHVAHRADFVRAFLLARHGGMWIDADCVALQPLQPVLDSLHDFDFLAHRERQGQFSNAFIGARPGSPIAAAYYAMVCQRLRSGRELGWTSLGGEALTAILQSATGPWRELDTELVQPICWSRPQAFFQHGSAADHRAALDPRALCYMLSNQQIRRFQSQHTGRDLMEEGTFFRFLLDLAAQAPTAGAKDTARFDARYQSVPFIVTAMRDIAPARVLEIGATSGRWALLLRELAEGGAHNDRPDIEAVVVAPDRPLPQLELLYDKVRTCGTHELAACIEAPADLVLIGDGLRDRPRELKDRLLDRALEVADYVILELNLAGAGRGSSLLPSAESITEALARDAVRWDAFRAPGGGAWAAFVLSRRDPRALRRSGAMRSVRDAMCHDHRHRREESVCGPGSSLAQTQEIRQRLPLLLQDLGARTLLEVPCGDFNWMRHVALGLDTYVGVDAVRDLVERNRERFETARRRFLTLDFTTDPLPHADVILCRDCLPHLSYRDIAATLGNFRRSGSRYLLTTTFTSRKTNTDIESGAWRTLNLQLAPFAFPGPLRVIPEKCTEGAGQFADKSLGLWRLDDLAING